MAGLIATDFVIVRFATGPYRFMRYGHIQLEPWLKSHQIEYTVHRNKVYFELPQHLRRYELITEDLCQDLRPIAREVKTRLSAISWSSLKKARQPLSETEMRLLVEAGIPLIL